MRDILERVTYLLKLQTIFHNSKGIHFRSISGENFTRYSIRTIPNGIESIWDSWFGPEKHKWMQDLDDRKWKRCEDPFPASLSLGIRCGFSIQGAHYFLVEICKIGDCSSRFQGFFFSGESKTKIMVFTSRISRNLKLAHTERFFQYAMDIMERM